MFTGLIEEVGTIQSVRHGARSMCADDRMQDGVGRQPDRRQYRSERCVSDGDKYGWQLLYRRCYGGDDEPQFSGTVKHRGEG